MDITKDEELQAKEFVKRAEVKTMRKDLQQLMETDALKERDKIVKGKTVEEEKAIRQLAEESKKEKEREILENQQREKVLSKNITEEREAEKQIKSYAEESEKQQIFLFESQRLGLEKQIDVFEQEKEPSLALEKNQILIDKKSQEAKLNNIIIEEQKIEKKRWAVEKGIKGLEVKLEKIDVDYQKITEEKNSLKEKITAIDRSLREIYSKIIKRVEDKKRGMLEQQQVETARTEQLSSEKKEKVQREQWIKPVQIPKEKEFLKGASDKMKERLSKSEALEEEQRRKFLEDIEKQTIEEQNKSDE